VGVLLLGADYYGTLAAVRCYGRAGIEVTVADENKRARAKYSRYVGERLVHPPLGEPEILVDWLVQWAERHPGTVLYPTNDHLAWLFAAERDRLGHAFRMFSPGEKTIIRLLDKMGLNEVCGDLGIEVPETHALGEPGQREASSIVEMFRYPLLLKPRIGVYLQGGIKGMIVRDRGDLDSQLAHFRRLVTFKPAFTARHPTLAEPIVQEYLTIAETSILSVAGFVGDDGQLVARAAMKVLQRPRKAGIGLCLEGRSVEEPLIEQLVALCRTVGYHGAFEAEFVVAGDRRVLIDFNPRFYSQMGFEVARGLPLPLLVWHAARGERSRVNEELERARAWRESGNEIYCHKRMLNLVLTLQRISGRMSGDDVKRWRSWHRQATRIKAATDAVHDRDDRMPAAVDTARWMADFAKHPRSFVNSFVLNR
jgi:predicted ATP-grasp superfamily ATP-dependent carboligase